MHVYQLHPDRDVSVRQISSSVLAFSAASSAVLSATTASKLVEYFSSCEGKRGGEWIREWRGIVKGWGSTQ